MKHVRAGRVVQATLTRPAAFSDAAKLNDEARSADISFYARCAENSSCSDLNGPMIRLATSVRRQIAAHGGSTDLPGRGMQDKPRSRRRSRQTGAFHAKTTARNDRG